MAVIDVFTYNGEVDMMKLHLGALYDKVDKFIIVEAKTTFSGMKKPLYYFREERHFKDYMRKIEYHVVNENYTPQEIALAQNSPNTIGAKHWVNEFLQKESIHKALAYYKVKDDDIVYIGDVDEIWEPYDPVDGPAKLKLRVYAYYLNNRSNEQFWGTLCSYYGDIRYSCLNHERSNTRYRTKDYHGWHFTSMGGVNEVRRKLENSYTEESYYTEPVKQQLEQRVTEGIDYLGRDFKFKIDATEWPPYLQKHILEYTHLCKHTYQR